ncbi:MAG TPA: dienelactone hydrolase family protein [Dehalococcoidia bacterium]|nr:dienelactone hydrolase family protein [Dehalococcoidia bacterium]
MTEIVAAPVAYPAGSAGGMGYLARPDDAGPHPGVVVIQEWWGLDGHIKDVAERFARAGFVALAPDLYHGEFATEPDEARKLAMALNRAQALTDLTGAVAYLQSLDAVAPKRVGCIGFCMGGSMALALAAATPDVAAAAPFYAGFQPPPEELAKIRAELFCAFGADDAGIPAERVAAFEETLRGQGHAATVKVYEGAPHSFFNDTRPSYRPVAAKDAWERSLALFQRVLV